MKFSHFLNETPLLSKSITREEIIKSVPTYKEFMRNKNKLEKVGYYKDYNFYHKTGNSFWGGGEYAIVDEDNEKIIVYSQLAKTSRPSLKMEYKTQKLLYKDINESSEIMKFFFDQIIHDQKFIMSDDLQSLGGKAFWKKLCLYWINSSFCEVGYLSVEHKKLIPFKSKEDFEEEFENLYKDNNYNTLYIKEK